MAIIACTLLCEGCNPSLAKEREQSSGNIPASRPSPARSSAVSIQQSPHYLSRTYRNLDEQGRRRRDALYLEALRCRNTEEWGAYYELLNEILAIDSLSPDIYYQRGTLLLTDRNGDMTDMGIKDIRKALELCPERDDISESLANVLTYISVRDSIQSEEDMKHVKGAIDIYKRLNDRKPSSKYLTQLSRLHLLQKDYSSALYYIEKEEELKGTSAEITMRKSAIYMLEGDGTRACKAIEDLCAEYPEELDYRVMLGDFYRQNDCPEMAEATYKDVLTASPDNGPARLALVSYYAEEGKDSLYYDMVGKTLTRTTVEERVRHGIFIQLLLTTLNGEKDSTFTESMIDKVMKQPVRNPEILESTLYYLSIHKNPTLYRLALERLLKVSPDDTSLRIQLITDYIREERYDDALNLCTEGENMFPDQTVYPYFQAVILSQQDRTDEALAVIATATQRPEVLEEEPSIASAMYCLQGDIFHEKGKKSQAYTAYEHAIALPDASETAYNNYAYFLAQDGGDLKKAERLILHVLKNSPEEPTYIDTYAWILFLQKRYEEARNKIEPILDGLAEEEANAIYFLHAGDIYYRCRKSDLALKYWIKALGLTQDEEMKAKLQLKIRTRKI